MLGERSLREIFCRRGVSLVFLNACQTGSGGRADFNKGVAQALVSHGLPALVANQYSVLDSSATSFAQHFYWALAQGMAIGQAAREARIAVNYSMQGDMIDWAVPVVYARDPRMTLCEPPAVATPAPAAASACAPEPARGSAASGSVWRSGTSTTSFRRSKDTLRRMTEAQAAFGFELVDLSAPLDIWDLEHKAPDGTPYLMPRSWPSGWPAQPPSSASICWPASPATGCATTNAQPLRLVAHASASRRWWWCRSPASRSCWSKARKPTARLANMAGGGAGRLHRAGSRPTSKAPKDCPMWHNPNRLLSHIVGAATFRRGVPQQAEETTRARTRRRSMRC